jgi:FHA domain
MIDWRDIQKRLINCCDCGGLPMDEHLTNDIFTADFIVDLSNVVRMDPRPGITNFGRLMDALKIRERDADIRIYAVADESLLHRRELPQADRRTLARWREGGLIDVTGDADPRILELAAMTGLPVISRDRYVGHREEHPWLQKNTEQFLEPYLEPGGRLVVRAVDLGVSPDWKVSQCAEQDLLKKQGLLAGPGRGPLREVLDRSWRCPERGCGLYTATRGGGAFLPRIRRGRATCEIHGRELLDDGPRPAVAQMKVLIDGNCVARFTVAGETSIAVGRSPADGISLAPWLDDREKSLISRTHFVLTLRGGRLLVRDQSTNGTRLTAAGKTGPEQNFKLEPGRDYPLGLGDLVSCSARIALTRSGRRFSSEFFDSGPDLAPRAGTPPSVTTRITVPPAAPG